MDQVRTALAWLQRQHFWVLSGVVALIALLCWAKASSQLSTLFNKNQLAIKSEFDNVQKVRSDPFHPNDDVNDKQAAQTKQQSAEVAKLWQQLYDRQRAHVLTWPVPPLSKEFGDYVDKLQFGEEIAPKWRSHYQNYVEGHFPELPKQIDARPLDTSAASGPGGEFSRSRIYSPESPGPGSPGSIDQDENDYICEWSDSDQAKIRDELNFVTRPSSIQIWVTQEDLWVYHTLLDVIAKTNQAAHASRMSNAAVRTVKELSVGSPAAQFNRTPGHLLVEPPAPPAAGLGGEGAPPVGAAGQEGRGPTGQAEFSPGRMGPGSGPMTEEQQRASLLSGRYLDAQGKPIPFAGGGAAPTDQSAPPPAATGSAAPLDLTVFGQEYKRLPVRMVLRINQRWLPFLIATCASEPLQIEVQEIGINTPDAEGTGGPGGVSYRSSQGPGGLGVSMLPDEPAQQPFPTQPEMVNVAIQGTIYIFNQPNNTLLQTPGGQPTTTASLAP